MPSPAFLRIIHHLSLAYLLALCLTGCATRAVHTSSALDRVASRAGLRYHEIPAGSFRLTTYARIRDINAPVTIYIEGEGQPLPADDPDAQPSLDPTTDGALGLRLAAVDPSLNVVYIARPCQFAPDDSACDPQSWSGGKFEALVLASVNRAIDHFALLFAQPRLNLVGYSGGGAIATLIAARRHDVVSLRTIAGLLDPDGAARFHGAEPQDDALDPMRIASKLALLPQIHYVGDRDQVFPPFLTGNFLANIGPSFCVYETHVADATHQAGWLAYWRRNAAMLPSCKPPGIF